MRKCLLATSAIAVALTLSGNSFAENNQTLPLTSTLAPNTAAPQATSSPAPAPQETAPQASPAPATEPKPVTVEAPAPKPTTAQATSPEPTAAQAPAPQTAAQPSGTENAAAAPATVAPAESTTSKGLVFSKDAEQAKPILSAQDVAVAVQLQDLIENKLRQYVPRQQDRVGVAAFYRKRDFAPLWVAGGKALPRAQQATEFLRGVTADGLDPADYPAPRFAGADPARLAVDEIALTNSVVTFVRHASIGRVAFTRVSGAVYFDQKTPDQDEVLEKLATSSDLRATLDSFNPQHAAYKALKAELAAVRGRAAAATRTIHIPDGPLLRPGMEDARVPMLRKRFNLADSVSLRYDDGLAAAVKNFQESASLNPDGVVGSSTVARLNGETRASPVDTIIANMERWRWQPHDLGNDYVMVNVPDYTLRAVDDGKTVWSTKIVVGKPGSHATPLLTETMKFITVNPTWNVPPSIIRNEYLPALARDPGALARIGLKMSHNADGSIRIYQPPGERNALGRIRFNFPNRFLVYQHDTPDKKLFDKTARAFSHGCMRVEDPDKYAEVLLNISQPEENYTAKRVRSMYGSGERTIKFKTPIPVYVTYQTAFVDQSGKLQTRADIYGLDKDVLAQLKGDSKVADVPIARNYSSGSKPVMGGVPRSSRRDDYAESFGGGPGWGPNYAQGEQGGRSNNAFSRFRVW